MGGWDFGIGFGWWRVVEEVMCVIFGWSSSVFAFVIVELCVKVGFLLV